VWAYWGIYARCMLTTTSWRRCLPRLYTVSIWCTFLSWCPLCGDALHCWINRKRYFTNICWIIWRLQVPYLIVSFHLCLPLLNRNSIMPTWQQSLRTWSRTFSMSCRRQNSIRVTQTGLSWIVIGFPQPFWYVDMVSKLETFVEFLFYGLHVHFLWSEFATFLLAL